MDIETYRKWIEWQMTQDMKWSNIEVDHIKPICMFDLSKDEELEEYSTLTQTRSSTKRD